jgi:hypothetical protein
MAEWPEGSCLEELRHKICSNWRGSGFKPAGPWVACAQHSASRCSPGPGAPTTAVPDRPSVPAAVWPQVRKSGLPAIFVFIAPPSMEELERRLRGRGTEAPEQVETRLKNAYQEMARCAGGALRLIKGAGCCMLAGRLIGR